MKLSLYAEVDKRLIELEDGLDDTNYLHDLLQELSEDDRRLWAAEAEIAEKVALRLGLKHSNLEEEIEKAIAESGLEQEAA